ncbi:hypothetical protein [Rhizobium sp. BK068]|uniref:hypothetical protein n=1 Tax=Rhizobium sp. BK068 TaxID=2512130 RepID=UPI001FDEDC15|nr:hypothetical protein [Rhizobium sp. BK068]
MMSSTMPSAIHVCRPPGTATVNGRTAIEGRPDGPIAAGGGGASLRSTSFSSKA